MTDRRRDPLPEGYQFGGEPPLLVEKCTQHGRERNAECAECRSLPRLEHTCGVRPGDVTAAGAGQTGETLTTSGWSANRDLGDEA